MNEQTPITYETIIALYPDFESAQNAVQELVNEGFDRQYINIITDDTEGRYQQYLDFDEHDDVDSEDGAQFGAIVGGLIGLGTALIPGIGPIIAIGPFATALIAGIGAGTGAITGGIAAGLINLGTNERTAEIYTEVIRRGGTLVMLTVNEKWESKVEDILENHNPIDVEDIETRYREDNWLGYDNTAQPFTMDEIRKERSYYQDNQPNSNNKRVRRYTSETSLDELEQRYRSPITDTKPVVHVDVPVYNESFDEYPYDSDFRNYHETTYLESENNYVTSAPAYHYGYRLGTSPSYTNMEWDNVVGDAQFVWQQKNGNNWDQIEPAVRYGWNYARG